MTSEAKCKEIWHEYMAEADSDLKSDMMVVAVAMERLCAAWGIRLNSQLLLGTWHHYGSP